MPESRMDFDKKCPNCGDVYHEHSNDEITTCMQTFHSEYDVTLASVLAVLQKKKLAKKWGQPSGDKRCCAFWPPDGSEPVTSTIPARDFSIYILINETTEPPPEPEKKSFFGGVKNEVSEPVEEPDEGEDDG